MINTETYDWSKFEIVFYYNQSIDKVFKAWTTSSGLESFFIKTARFQSTDKTVRNGKDIVKKGDHYHWEWRHPFTVEGKIIEVKHNKEFSFTFGNMKVQIHFHTTKNQTELHLVQFDIPNTADGKVMGHLNCRCCWVFFLTNLKSVLDFGNDLRDQDPHRVSSLEVGFLPQQNVDSA